MSSVVVYQENCAMIKTRVVNCLKAEYDVYIGRSNSDFGDSVWGNPFVIGKDGTREEVIDKYRQWIITQHNLMEKLQELKGKRLGCYCYPNRCHGDVLVELIHDNTWFVY